ncbi:hypothetical protein BGZ93_008484 [Podila epicladia]|nr:hypothetical protein BGZ92_006309 [Podila epicladia]KAG0099243.1 hypothetical protein BGZ93_008484 [Podila epicladia]
MSSPRLTLLAALFALTLTTISSVHANINCALPQGGTYNAGDPMTLDWGDDGSKPKVTDIISMKSALYCNTGNKIADIPIAQFVGPSNVTVPFVGNATTAGGTQGACAGNAFHVEYSGEYMGGFLDLVKTSWGPVRCGTVTITPSPNNTLPVTTSTSATPTSATTTTKKTSTSSSSSTNRPSETPDQKEDSNKGNTTIIIVGIIAGLVLILLFSAFMWHMRRQKIRRMESAIMPWSNQPNNFSKMSSSMDDGPNSPGKLAAAGAGALGAAAAVSHPNKAQPALPQPSYGAGGGYYDDDRYGYQQGYNNTPGSNYHHQGGYEGYEDDTYYNPHYATQNNKGYGHDQGQGQGQGQGYEMNQYNGSYHSSINASRTPYQDPYQTQQPVSSTGYFPPPPPMNSGTSSPPPSVPLSTPGLTTVPISSSTTLSASSSPKRGPQTILPEMGRPSDEPTSPRS